MQYFSFLHQKYMIRRKNSGADIKFIDMQYSKAYLSLPL